MLFSGLKDVFLVWGEHDQLFLLEKATELKKYVFLITHEFLSFICNSGNAGLRPPPINDKSLQFFLAYTWDEVPQKLLAMSITPWGSLAVLFRGSIFF